MLNVKTPNIKIISIATNTVKTPITKISPPPHLTSPQSPQLINPPKNPHSPTPKSMPPKKNPQVILQQLQKSKNTHTLHASHIQTMPPNRHDNHYSPNRGHPDFFYINAMTTVKKLTVLFL